jgi:hypothetical protein
LPRLALPQEIRSPECHSGLISITIGFNEPLNSDSVGNLHLYSVLGGVKKHQKIVDRQPPSIQGVSLAGNTRVAITLAMPYDGALRVTVHGGIVATDGTSSHGNFSAVVR